MPSIAKVIAELRHLQIEPGNYRIQSEGGAGSDHMTLTLNNKKHKQCTGVKVLQLCAAAAGKLGPTNGRGFHYKADDALVKAVAAELAAMTSVPAPQTPDAAAPSSAGRRLRSVAAAVRQAAPSRGAAAGQHDVDEEAIEVDDDDDGDDDKDAAADCDSDPRQDIQGFKQMLSQLWGHNLVDCWHHELERWQAAQQTHKDAQRALQAQRDEGLRTLRSMVRPGPNLTQMTQALELEMRQQLEGLAAAERLAAERCKLVQHRLDLDPTASLMVYRGAGGAGPAGRRLSPSWYHVAGLLALVAGLMVQLVSPGLYQGLKSLVMNLGRQ